MTLNVVSIMVRMERNGEFEMTDDEMSKLKWVEIKQIPAAQVIRFSNEVKTCEECGSNIADYPSKICVGCHAYKDHTSHAT